MSAVPTGPSPLGCSCSQEARAVMPNARARDMKTLIEFISFIVKFIRLIKKIDLCYKFDGRGLIHQLNKD
jgi:hypothetical protein